MPIAAISHRLTPEQLLDRRASEDLPVFRVLAGLRPLLDAPAMPGVTGSAGFQLATGLSAAHPDSDLDLLLRAEQPLPQRGAPAAAAARRPRLPRLPRRPATGNPAGRCGARRMGRWRRTGAGQDRRRTASGERSPAAERAA